MNEHKHATELGRTVIGGFWKRAGLRSPQSQRQSRVIDQILPAPTATPAEILLGAGQSAD